jgi:hypothetical protein
MKSNPFDSNDNRIGFWNNFVAGLGSGAGTGTVIAIACVIYYLLTGANPVTEAFAMIRRCIG